MCFKGNVLLFLEQLFLIPDKLKVIAVQGMLDQLSLPLPEIMEHHSLPLPEYIAVHKLLTWVSQVHHNIDGNFSF